MLEIGAGYCDFINQIFAREKLALDFDLNAGKFCAPDVNFMHGSILEFDLDKKVDVIFASNFFEHFTIEELRVIFLRLRKILEDNGKLIVIQPNYFYSFRNYWDDYTHKTVFSHNNLPDFLIEQGFEVKFLKKRFMPFSFKSKLPTSYWLTRLYLRLPFKPFAKQLLIVSEKQEVN